MDCTLRAGIVKCLIDCTKELWSSVNFVFDADGLRLRAMDSSHVALASLTLTPAAFFSFKCLEKVQLGIYTDALSMVLKSCAADDQITIRYTLNSDYISISHGDDRHWELKLLEIEQDEMAVPEQLYDISATAVTSDLQKCLKDLREMAADTIAVSMQQHVMAFTVEGHLGSGTASMRDGIGIEGHMDCACKYSLKYLSAFMKGNPSFCPKVRLRMGKDTPLCVTYDLEGGALEFYLAPRIED